jgi:polysaccharide deacetylase 2 family uncharacterized protein YibQ
VANVKKSSPGAKGESEIPGKFAAIKARISDLEVRRRLEGLRGSIENFHDLGPRARKMLAADQREKALGLIPDPLSRQTLKIAWIGYASLFFLSAGIIEGLYGRATEELAELTPNEVEERPVPPPAPIEPIIIQQRVIAPPPAALPVVAPSPQQDPNALQPIEEPRAGRSTRSGRQLDRPIPQPDPSLLESGPYGPVPRISPDGRTSIRTYGRVFDRSEGRPRIGVIIGGAGLSSKITEEAIERLPAAVTLAFNPYSRRFGGYTELARARGMETMLALPLEPLGYPVNDPGNRTLLINVPLNENIDRLNWALSRFSGYVGAVGAIGSMRGERFSATEMFGQLQDSIRTRGLLYVDPRPGAKHPERTWGRAVDLVVEDGSSRERITQTLSEAIKMAKERGVSLVLTGDLTPTLIDSIVPWSTTLEREGVVLAPMSSLIRRPESQRQQAANRPPS